MDEAGTPFGVTIDGETSGQGTVTVRHRDTMLQERVALDRVGDYIVERLGAD
jgi:glycyl-tRNA synthetase